MSNPKTRATPAFNSLIALALGLKFSSLQPKMIPGPEGAAWPAPPRPNVVISHDLVVSGRVWPMVTHFGTLNCL
jgi:hypothetical protein